MFKFSPRLILALFIVLFFSFLYTHNLIPATSFEGDLARDAYDMLKISKGDFTLLGPKLSFGGIYSSPFYYYLFAPILFLFRFNFESVIYSNAIFFAITLGITFYFLYPKLKTFRSMLFILCLGLAPLNLFLARHPGNAFTIMIFLQLLLLLFITNKQFSLTTLLAIGFLSGVVVSLHPVTLLIVAPLFILVYQRAQKKQLLLFYFFSALIPFVPLILFELKHNFIMFTNTFIHQSYKIFVNNENLGGPLKVSSNPFVNFFLLNSKMANFSVINPLLLLLIAVLVTKNKRWHMPKIIVLTIISLILLSLFLRHQFARHYLYPFVALIIFITGYYVAKSRYYWLLLLYLLIIFFNFPKQYFEPSQRQIVDFEKTIDNIVKSRFISTQANLNLIQLRRGVSTTPYGFEYRYFLLKNNIPTLNEFQYNLSNHLLIIAEYPQKPQQIDNWEIREFGKDNWIKIQKIRTNSREIYLITK